MKKIFENFGIGIDIAEVDRFRKKKFQKNKNFYNKILYKSEIDFYKESYTKNAVYWFSMECNPVFFITKKYFYFMYTVFL